MSLKELSKRQRHLATIKDEEIRLKLYSRINDTGFWRFVKESVEK